MIDHSHNRGAMSNSKVSILFAGDLVPNRKPGELLCKRHLEEVFGDILPVINNCDLFIANPQQ